MLKGQAERPYKKALAEGGMSPYEYQQARDSIDNKQLPIK